jgi:hypothetical protein
VWPVQTGLHQLSCPDYPALSFLFWLSCHSSLLSVLSRLYCPGCLVPAVQPFLLCSGPPLLSILSRLTSPN